MVRKSLEEPEDGLHLVVARPAGAAGTLRRLRLMVALIEALEPRGDYAVTAEGGGLHCRFERAGDAARRLNPPPMHSCTLPHPQSRA